MTVFLENDVIPKFADQGMSIQRELIMASRDEIQPAVLGDQPEPMQLSVSGDRMTLRDVHPLEMARQMALITYEVYSRINSAELLQRRWMMAHKTLLSPSVLNMQSHEHRMKNWFATQVLAEHDRKKRAVVLSRLILVAVESIKLHNFSGAVCIFQALEDPSVKRLKRTWGLIPSPLMLELNSIVTMVDKSNDYRMLMAEMSSTAVPGIPFIGAVLPHIEDIEDRLPYVLHEKQRNRGMMLSLSKVRLVGNLVNQIMRFQTHAYNFKPLDKVVKLLDSKVVDDLALLRVSLTLEPDDDDE
jgi:son of sevenless-like protein